ncbi:hypothetical protein BJX76DRAFT_345825 [Aspergillus varians]
MALCTAWTTWSILTSILALTSLTNAAIPSQKTIWQPPVGATWQIVLSTTLGSTIPDVSVFDIDLFNTPKSTIDHLHTLNRRVICYFSAGTYEDWRPDAPSFPASDIGSPLEDWEGESWIDLRSAGIRDIMTSRLDIAVAKGCDGVDPDNVDAYNNDQGGLDLTAEDSIDFMDWLAGEAHARGLSIGLKNAVSIIPSVIGKMQWSVNEQCTEWDECDEYTPFLAKGKPVFHIEYPKGDEVNDQKTVSGQKKENVCSGFENAGLFSTLIKNMNLDRWVQPC